MSRIRTARAGLSVHAGIPRRMEVREQALRPSIETGHLVTVDPGLGANAGAPCYLQLVQKLLAIRAGLPGSGVFAFTAANPGDGVSFVVKSLARELAAASGEQGAVYTVKESSPASKNWGARLLAGSVDEIRRQFGWVLVDCPSLRESDLALALAPHTDGVVFVVAADRTKRAEIVRAQKSLATSSAALLGFVLNKRTYPVPDFLYHRL